MPQGGGFCEIHGPYDPPHLVCPFCAAQDDQRRVYGPPPDAPPPRPDNAPLPADESYEPPPAVPIDSGFVRQTVEPEHQGATELIPREGALPDPGDLDALSAGLIGYLIVKEPPEQRGTVLSVRANQTIGREGDVQWDDSRLSRLHARVTVEPPADAPDEPPVFHLWPFGPTNPVFINGHEARGATPLRENDEIRLGDTLFVFKVLVD